MTTTDPAPAATGSRLNPVIVSAAIAGALALYGLYIAQTSGRDLSIKVGDQVIELGADPDLTTVIDEAMAKNPAVFEAILSTRDFYKVTSPRLVDALARIDAAKEGEAPVAIGMRKLLWNLEGPFKGPGTLREADARFMAALEELDQPVVDASERSALIIELWQRSLERTPPLGLRLFRSRVVPVRAEADGVPRVYFCPGVDGLALKHVAIFRSGSATSVEGVLTEDTRQRLPCDGDRVTLQELFAGAPMLLGVDPARYALLSGTGGDPAEEIEASFEVQPSRPVVAQLPAPN